ncbi:hypothetical protein EBZ39_08010 [bacterium]|nr:hypothetical protein [bacterium]
MLTEEEIAQISELIAENNDIVDREIEGYIATLRLLMQTAILRELSRLPEDRNLRQSEVIRLLGGMESIIMDSEDIQDHVLALEDVFILQSRLSDRVYRLANNNQRPPEDVTREAEKRLAIFTNARQQNVMIMARAYANEVRQGLADSIMTEGTANDFNLTDVPATRIFQALDNDLKTASSSFERIRALGQRRKYVLYAGPRDARNRPFCAQRVNKVFPLEVVYNWDNGQGLPAYIYCGGYGCRHQLIPVENPRVVEE